MGPRLNAKYCPGLVPWSPDATSCRPHPRKKAPCAFSKCLPPLYYFYVFTHGHTGYAYISALANLAPTPKIQQAGDKTLVTAHTPHSRMGQRGSGTCNPEVKLRRKLAYEVYCTLNVSRVGDFLP